MSFWPETNLEEWPIQVAVETQWFKKLDPNEFEAWSKENDIQWDIKSTSIAASPQFLFKSEADAIMFRLRYGL